MKKLLAALPFICACTALQAAPIQIIDLPTEISGGFAHNNFHDATIKGGADGEKLAWFTLGAGFSSYDPATGDLILNINLWDPITGQTPVGTAVGTGNLTATAFNDHDGGLIGTIKWVFNLNANADPRLTNTTTSFADINYATSDLGYTPNSYFPSDMTLWGADCNLSPSDGLCIGHVDEISSGIGVDFVATFVPVPAAVWLFGSGLIALVGVSRRKSRQS